MYLLNRNTAVWPPEKHSLTVICEVTVFKHFETFAKHWKVKLPVYTVYYCRSVHLQYYQKDTIFVANVHNNNSSQQLTVAFSSNDSKVFFFSNCSSKSSCFFNTILVPSRAIRSVSLSCNEKSTKIHNREK